MAKEKEEEGEKIMARVPEFTRTVFKDRARPGNIEAIALARGGREAEGLRQEAGQLKRDARIAKNIGDDFARERQAEEQVRAQEELNKHRRELTTLYEQQKTERMTNPTGFAKDFDTLLQERLAKTEETANTLDDQPAFDLDYYRAGFDNYRTNTFQSSTNWESGMRQRNTVVSLEQNIDDMNNTFMLSNPSYSDLVKHQDEIRAYTGTAGAKILSPEQVVKFTGYGIDQATTVFINKEMQENPRQLKQILRYGLGGKDNLSEFIGKDIEGVEPEEIAKKWDKRLDDFDPEFQAIALDAIVSHGAKNAWEMIEAADEDPYSLIAARQAKYQELAQTNPEKYAPEMEKWNKRLDTLSEFTQTMESGGNEFLERTNLVDPDILAATLLKLPKAIKDKENTERKELENAELVDVSTQKLNQSEISKLIYDDEIPYEERLKAISEADFQGLITDKFATEAKQFLNSKKAAGQKAYDPEAIAGLYSKKELLFKKRTKRGIRSVTVSKGMLDDAAELQLEALRLANEGILSTSEAKSIVKSIDIDLTLAQEKIGKGHWFSDYTHDENAFRSLTEKTEDPGLRNQMFRDYTEQSENLDDLEKQGASKEKIEKESQKIIDRVVKKALHEAIPGASGLDKMPNNAFTITGDRIFVGSHSDTPKPDAKVKVEFKLMEINGQTYRVFPDGTGERVK